jgi:fructose 1,6-bisphosphate aldolase/phosphatase
MKITVSVIKADVGSIGGHITPSKALLDSVEAFVKTKGKDIAIDSYIGKTGDDIHILLSHTRGVGSEEVHKLAWDAFVEGTRLAKEQGLYGAGQDLLKDAFSGNVKGLGPAVAEMEFEERPNEPFLMFSADKTDPGAYNLPLYLAFCDPMHNAGLLLSPKMATGFKFNVMDVSYTKADRVIELNAPEEIYDIAALLRDLERFVVESVHSRASGDIAAVVSTTRLHNIAGKYTGKDDPVMPVKRGGTISFFDGPPIVSCLAFCVHNGKFTEPADAFDHPYWDYVRNNVSRKSEEIRRQGFFGAAMLPYSELEYGGIVSKMEMLDKKFKVRK